MEVKINNNHVSNKHNYKNDINNQNDKNKKKRSKVKTSTTKKDRTEKEKEEQRLKLQERTKQNQDKKQKKRETDLKYLIEFLKIYSPKDINLPNLFQKNLQIPPSCSSLRINTLKINYEEILPKLTSISNGLNISKHPLLDDTILVRSKKKEEKYDIIDNNNSKIFVSLKVGQSVLRGADIFTPGIIAAEKGILKDSKISIFIDIDQYFSRGTMIDPENSKNEEKSSRKVLPSNFRKLFIGNGISQVNRKDFFIKGNQIGVKVIERIEFANELFSLKENNLNSFLFLQNIPSITVVHVLDPQPGETILDACAAPGGKTSHIAIRMKNHGKVFSVDRKKTGIEKIENLCKSMEINIVQALATDSTLLLEEEDLKKESKFHFSKEYFDRILLDPPCSGIGQRPKFTFDEYSISQLKGNPAYQRKLFRVCWKLLKPGGILVYSTCTINPLENEGNVSWALSEFKDIQLESQKPFLGNYGLVNKDFPNLDENRAKLIQRFYPENDFIGFFIAKFRKLK